MKKTISKLLFTGTFSLLLSPIFAQTDSTVSKTESNTKTDTTVVDSTKAVDTEKATDSTKAKPNAVIINNVETAAYAVVPNNMINKNVAINDVSNTRKFDIKEEQNTTA